MDRGGARRGDIDDAGIRQRVLQAQARAALLRGRLIAAFAFVASGILHGMALVEDDDAVEIGRPTNQTVCRTRETFVSRPSVRRVA